MEYQVDDFLVVAAQSHLVESCVGLYIAVGADLAEDTCWSGLIDDVRSMIE